VEGSIATKYDPAKFGPLKDITFMNAERVAP
jgi:hypothetical protein